MAGGGTSCSWIRIEQLINFIMVIRGTKYHPGYKMVILHNSLYIYIYLYKDPEILKKIQDFIRHVNLASLIGVPNFLNAAEIRRMGF